MFEIGRQDEYAWFVGAFYTLTGIDLSRYKRQQMERRLTTLRDKRGFATFADYLSACRSNPGLLAELLDRMTINVSEFFRNRARWDMLRFELWPEIARPGRSVRAWSAACSTGQEPYTLAFVLASRLPLSEFSILATDIDEGALTVARQGSYPATDLASIPDELRGALLDVRDDRGQVAAELRARIEFRRHNLLADVFAQGFDVIVCRNVLIYFTDEAKEQVYRKFATALRPGGILFVGSTEQIFHAETFGLVQRRPFFYQRLQ